MTIRAHQTDDNGLILRTIVVNSLSDLPNLIDASVGGGAGDTYVNGVLTRRQPTLSEAKAWKRRTIREEAMQRITDRMGEVMADPDMLALVKTIWLSIAVAARQPTADMQWLIDTAQAVQTALASVNSASTVAAVLAVNVAWP